MKEKFHRPAFTFAPADASGTLVKGSGRSIAGFHLRDALDLIAKREPGMLAKFGGHAMAAGLTLAAADVPRFTAAFEAVGREWLTEDALARVVMTDGDLEDAYFTPQFVEMLDAAVWGQGFPAPTFSGEFDVMSQALVKDRHLKLQLMRGRQRFQAIWFNRTEHLPARARVAYRLASDTWNGVSRVQLIVEHAMAPESDVPPLTFISRTAAHHGVTFPTKAPPLAAYPRPGHDPRSAIISPFYETKLIDMEAERLNAIESSLADLRRRAGRATGVSLTTTPKQRV